MTESGRTLGPYQLEDSLGGTRTVFRARHVISGDVVCLKLLPEHLRLDAISRGRRRRELLATRHVEHDGVGHPLDFVDADGRLFLVMEYIEGAPLSMALFGGATLPVSHALRTLRGACEAVAAAHAAHATHGCLEPDKVLLGQDGLIHVVGFGFRDEDALKHPGGDAPADVDLCTAPERWSGAFETTDADVWALGALLYRCLSGRYPFEAETRAELSHQVQTNDVVPPTFEASVVVKPAIEAVVLRALARDPTLRYPDAAVFARALVELEGMLPYESAPAVQPAEEPSAEAADDPPPPPDDEPELAALAALDAVLESGDPFADPFASGLPTASEEGPPVEEPVAEPVVEPVAAEEPVAEEPVAEEPVAEEPAAEEPAVEPVVEPVAAEEPVVEPSATAEPVVEPTEERVVEPVAAEEPIVDEPVPAPPAAIAVDEPEAAAEMALAAEEALRAFDDQDAVQQAAPELTPPPARERVSLAEELDFDVEEPAPEAASVEPLTPPPEVAAVRPVVVPRPLPEPRRQGSSKARVAVAALAALAAAAVFVVLDPLALRDAGEAPAAPVEPLEPVVANATATTEPPVPDNRASGEADSQPATAIDDAGAAVLAVATEPAPSADAGASADAGVHDDEASEPNAQGAPTEDAGGAAVATLDESATPKEAYEATEELLEATIDERELLWKDDRTLDKLRLKSRRQAKARRYQAAQRTAQRAISEAQSVEIDARLVKRKLLRYVKRRKQLKDDDETSRARAYERRARKHLRDGEYEDANKALNAGLRVMYDADE